MMKNRTVPEVHCVHDLLLCLRLQDTGHTWLSCSSFAEAPPAAPQGRQQLRPLATPRLMSAGMRPPGTASVHT